MSPCYRNQTVALNYLGCSLGAPSLFFFTTRDIRFYVTTFHDQKGHMSKLASERRINLSKRKKVQCLLFAHSSNWWSQDVYIGGSDMYNELRFFISMMEGIDLVMEPFSSMGSSMASFVGVNGATCTYRGLFEHKWFYFKAQMFLEECSFKQRCLKKIFWS